jgi:hypothetical protein
MKVAKPRQRCGVLLAEFVCGVRRRLIWGVGWTEPELREISTVALARTSVECVRMLRNSSIAPTGPAGTKSVGRGRGRPHLVELSPASARAEISSESEPGQSFRSATAPSVTRVASPEGHSSGPLRRALPGSQVPRVMLVAYCAERARAAPGERFRAKCGRSTIAALAAIGCSADALTSPCLQLVAAVSAHSSAGIAPQLEAATLLIQLCVSCALRPSAASVASCEYLLRQLRVGSY